MTTVAKLQHKWEKSWVELAVCQQSCPIIIGCAMQKKEAQIFGSLSRVMLDSQSDFQCIIGDPCLVLFHIRFAYEFCLVSIWNASVDLAPRLCIMYDAH